MARGLTTATMQEDDALAHLRGWCHNRRTCPICRAQDGLRAELSSDEALDALRASLAGEPSPRA
jgi:hypothetical protein